MGCGASSKYQDSGDEVVAFQGDASNKASKEVKLDSKSKAASKESLKAAHQRVHQLDFGDFLEIADISSKYFFSDILLSRRTKVVVRLVLCRTAGTTRAAKQHTLRNVPGGRLTRSARLIKKQAVMQTCCHHPNIVELLEVFISQSALYEILEYCDGGSLYEAIIDSEGLTEREAANSLLQVAKAVAYLHSRRIAHRDCKPEHVLLKSPSAVVNAQMKLVDFSTACIFTSSFMSEQVSTPYYASPQVFQKRYSEACDVWSLGVMLYVLLLGYPKKIEAILKDPAIKPRELHTFVTRGRFKKDEGFNELLSEGANGLLASLLSDAEEGRISAAAAIENVWLLYQAPQTDLTPEEMMAQTTSLGEVFDRAGRRMLVMSNEDESKSKDLLLDDVLT
eukprot:TRINITY_DN8121_c0_g5_i1.p1 TRINITY_DN8121_c0_g5~~TRINITY_DN8121_c0_g5_i1.p1  ORF type:complete len:407 (+),score=94.19 TRINITY_DN8121_c0_g5_i1:43-1221(+)